MSVPSMFTASAQPIAVCEVCGEGIAPLDEKVQTQKRTMHKQCFKCAICDQPLTVGACSLDHVISRYYGPLWFCNAHMMLGSGQKMDLLKQKAAGK